MSQTVSVGCKLPWGLILEMGEPGEENYKRVIVVGSSGAHKGHATPNGQMPVHLMAHGYGITHGVPKDFFDAWKEKHKRLDAVKNGLIFDATAKESVELAKAFESTPTGYERLNPADAPKGITRVVEETAA